MHLTSIQDKNENFRDIHYPYAFCRKLSYFSSHFSYRENVKV